MSERKAGYLCVALGLIIFAMLILSGCTDAAIAKRKSMGQAHKVTLYSGGQAIRVFHSTGKVENEKDSDGYFFKDRDSGKLVTLSGTVVIEVE